MKKTLKISLAVLCISVCALVAALPSIVSTSFVSQSLLNAFNDTIAGKVYAGKVSLGWLSGAVIEQFALEDPEGQRVVSCKTIVWKKNLLALLLSPSSIGQITVEQPRIHLIDETGKGSFSLYQAFNSKKEIQAHEETLEHKKSHSSGREKEIAQLISEEEESGFLRLQVHIKNGKIVLEKMQPKRVEHVAEHINGLFAMGKELALDVSCETLNDGQKGSLDLAIDSTPTLQIKATAKNLPMSIVTAIVDLIDPFYSKLSSALIGDTINTAHFLYNETKNGFIVDTQGNSSLLTANISFGWDNDSLVAEKNGFIRSKIDKEAFSYYTKLLGIGKNFTIEQPADYTLQLTNNEKTETAPRHIQITCSQDAPLLIHSRGRNKTFSMKSLCDIAYIPEDNQFTAHTNIDISQGSRTGALLLEITNSKQKNDTHMRILGKTTGTIAQIMDEVAALDVPIFQAIGNIAKLSIQADSPALFAKPYNGNIILQSERLNGTGKFLIQHDTCTLLDTTGSFTLLPEFCRLLPKDVSIASPLTIQCLLKNAVIPTHHRIFKKCIVDGTVDILPCTFKVPQWGNIALNMLQAHFQKQAHGDLHVHNSFLLSSAEDKKLAFLVGETFEGTIAFDLSSTKIRNGSAAISSAAIKATIPLFECSFSNAFSLHSLKPVEGKYLLPKGALATLFPNFKEIVLGSSTCDVVINPFSFTRTKDGCTTTPLKGNCAIAALPLLHQNQVIDTYSFSFPFTYDTTQDRLEMSAHCNSINKSSIPTELQMTYTICPFLFPHAHTPIEMVSTATFQSFPTQILALLSHRPELGVLFGKQLSGDWNFSIHPSSTSYNTCQLHIEGDEFMVDGALAMNGEWREIPSKAPIHLSWNITPERFTTLMSLYHEGSIPIALLSPSRLEFDCVQLRLPVSFFNEGKQENRATLLDAIECESVLRIQEMSLKKKQSDHAISIAPFTARLSIPRKGRVIAFEVSNPLLQKKTIGQCSIKGEVRNLWNDTSLQVGQSEIFFDASLKEIPLDVVHYCIFNKELGDLLLALMGDTVNASIKVDINKFETGSIDTTIHSTNLNTAFSAVIQNGYLRLKQPCTSYFTLTKQAGNTLLTAVNPLLITAASSEHPIVIWIDSAGFCIPLKPFSLQGISIESMKIDPGVLRVRNGGILRLMLTLLKFNTLISRPEMNLWFTPIYIRCHDGIITYKRADALLADSVPMATWGKINLVNDSLDMVVGIPVKTLPPVLGIQLLKDDYMIQVAIKGTTSSPKLDTLRLAAKLAAMTLQGQGILNTPGNILGGLVNAAVSLGSDEAPVPPPTTQPFPWDVKKEK